MGLGYVLRMIDLGIYVCELPILFFKLFNLFSKIMNVPFDPLYPGVILVLIPVGILYELIQFCHYLFHLLVYLTHLIAIFIARRPLGERILGLRFIELEETPLKGLEGLLKYIYTANLNLQVTHSHLLILFKGTHPLPEVFFKHLIGVSLAMIHMRPLLQSLNRKALILQLHINPTNDFLFLRKKPHHLIFNMRKLLLLLRNNFLEMGL